MGKILFQIFILLKPKSLFTNPNSQLGTNQIKIKKRNNHINGYRNSFTLLCQLCMKIGVIATLSVGKRKLIITFNRNTIIAQEAAKLPKAKAWGQKEIGLARTHSITFTTQYCLKQMVSCGCRQLWFFSDLKSWPLAVM